VFLIAIGILGYAAFGSKRRTLRQTLPTWITVAAVLAPSYTALRVLPVHEDAWRIWLPTIALISTVVTGVLTVRGRGLRGWAQHLVTGMAACALYMLLVYLAWRLPQWHISMKVYAFAVLCWILAPLLRAREEARKPAFPVLVIAVMMTASVFTPTALWFTHLAILTPWPILAIAAIADLVARRAGLDALTLDRVPALKRHRWTAALSLGLIATVALGAMLLYDDLEVDVAYYRGLAKFGGKGDHTHASYRLVDYLQEQGITEVAAMDWGIQDVVQFLSEGEINPAEVFGYENREDVDPAFAIRIRERLADPETVYVFRDRPLFQNRRQRFDEIVQEEGRTVVVVATIYDWAAIPIFKVVRVTS
jgi:hypothetical protein